MSVEILIIFLPRSIQTCVVGTQKNRLNSKEPSHWDGSFEYPQHMFELIGKNIV